jgi:hypothetical protein
MTVSSKESGHSTSRGDKKPKSSSPPPHDNDSDDVTREE